MSLTYGSGPFGQRPVGRFNLELPREGLLYVEESPKWIRARFAGETVADSRHPRLLHEHARLPMFLFPEEDVRSDLLSPSGRTKRDPVKGELRMLDLAGDGRDPYSRIDVRETSRHVVVRVHGQVVADTSRAKVLFEAGLPPRWYTPADDVRRELLEPSDKQTTCAYKGFASYYHVRVGDELEDDLSWTYRDPLHDAAQVKDMLAFFNERVDLEVDGEPQDRPWTQWS